MLLAEYRKHIACPSGRADPNDHYSDEGDRLAKNYFPESAGKSPPEHAYPLEVLIGATQQLRLPLSHQP